MSVAGIKKAAPDGKAKIAWRIVERTAEMEALEGALKNDKANLKCFVSPHYFRVNHQKREVPSSVSVL